MQIQIVSVRGERSVCTGRNLHASELRFQKGRPAGRLGGVRAPLPERDQDQEDRNSSRFLIFSAVTLLAF
jgi:hypothetical protein